ncbi:MAG: tetratricopeptide repeat protein [Chloroflexia bacterium]
MLPRRPPGDAPADLLLEAGAAARVGDLDEAERLYRRAIEHHPDSVEAWLGLGTVLSDPERKAACFRRVLELDPQNAEAQASLERLRALLPAEEPEVLTCAFHPQVQTVLRCSQCGRPICVRCAHPFPVGQLCPICVGRRRPLSYQPGLPHLLASGAATLAAATLLGLPAAYLARTGLGLLLAILGGPFAGGLLAQAALWAGGRRRGPAVQTVVVLATLAGSLLGALPSFLPYGLGHLWGGTLNLGLYAALAAASAAAWLR